MSETTPKYILVENYIKEAIRRKQITDRLPGERVLAQDLGYSYMTIRKAVNNLVDAKVLYKIPTKGTFVNQDQDKKNSHLIIGYFLDSCVQSGISSPYYSMVFNALEKEANKHNYSLIYFSDANQDKLSRVLSKLDGVIATCMPRVESTILEINKRVPTVVIDNRTTDKTIPSVIIDNFNANVASVDYISSLGHKHIGFITGLEDSDVGKSRYAGYQYGLKKNNLQFESTLIYQGNYAYEAGIEGANYFLSLQRYPSAIICANDSMALGAIKRFSQAGLKVPKDISIIGFDNIEVAPQVTPALTTVAAPINEIARHALNILENLLKGQAPSQQHIELTAQLIIRQTCTSFNHSVAA